MGGEGGTPMVAMATAIALNLFHLLRMKQVLGGGSGDGGGVVAKVVTKSRSLKAARLK